MRALGRALRAAPGLAERPPAAPAAAALSGAPRAWPALGGGAPSWWAASASSRAQALRPVASVTAPRAAASGSRHGPLAAAGRPFAAAAGAAPQMSAAASQALGSIKDTLQRTQAVQLSRSQKRSFPGNIHRYKTKGGRPEFHNVDRNRHGRIFEPWHNFEIIISASKNNCWITVLNKGWRYRTVFWSNAGNVGYRQAMKKTEQATQAIALNVARKLKRLGVTCAEVTFRKLMKVETCLQAFQSVGLQITRLTHQPRLPQGDPAKPRKQRRV